MIKISVTKTGDWQLARDILKGETKLKAAINSAVYAEALHAVAQIKKGIKEQAPAGKPFKPLDPLTLMLRQAKGFRGRKALIVTAALMNAVAAKKLGPGVVAVGVFPGGGKVKGLPVHEIARINEYGSSMTIRVTPRMRAWLMAQIRKLHGQQYEKGKGRDAKGRFMSRTKLPAGKGKLKRGVMVIKIPPRPFISPVLKVLKANRASVNMRLEDRIAKYLGGKMGKPSR